MTADDVDPLARWQSISTFYAEWARQSSWSLLTPMIDLTAWVAEQSMATPLYPSTSLCMLLVSLWPGYHPDLPFFACGANERGRFSCELCLAGCSSKKKLFPMDRVREAFTEYTGRLREFAGTPEAQESVLKSQLTQYAYKLHSYKHGPRHVIQVFGIFFPSELRGLVLSTGVDDPGMSQGDTFFSALTLEQGRIVLERLDDTARKGDDALRALVAG